MIDQFEWHDARFRETLRTLDAPALAQETLRRIPTYVAGYRDLCRQLEALTDLHRRYDLIVRFAIQWGLSFPCRSGETGLDCARPLEPRCLSRGDGLRRGTRTVPGSAAS